MRADARRNRERVLAAAHDVFAAEGVGVPVDTIAARAGVGVGTLYRHFPTKESLFTAIIESRLQSLAADARQLAESDAPGEAFFDFLASLAERGTVDMAMVDALESAGVDVQLPSGEVKGALMDAMAVLLARAQAVGAVRSDVAADDVLTLLAGTCKVAGRHGDLPLAGRCAFKVICDGLRVPAAAASA